MQKRLTDFVTFGLTEGLTPVITPDRSVLPRSVIPHHPGHRLGVRVSPLVDTGLEDPNSSRRPVDLNIPFYRGETFVTSGCVLRTPLTSEDLISVSFTAAEKRCVTGLGEWRVFPCRPP